LIASASRLQVRKNCGRACVYSGRRSGVTKPKDAWLFNTGEVIEVSHKRMIASRLSCPRYRWYTLS
jgi:hypothetical protein